MSVEGLPYLELLAPLIFVPALRSIGDELPTESITEDMLFSMTLLRNGYITRYLCERLAVGLAREGLKAFFVQR